ncbi:MAG TPA: hypothetical protein VGM91_08740 [Conexibacter sp.]|jgi:hypothetical protein
MRTPKPLVAALAAGTLLIGGGTAFAATGGPGSGSDSGSGSGNSGTTTQQAPPRAPPNGQRGRDAPPPSPRDGQRPPRDARPGSPPPRGIHGRGDCPRGAPMPRRDGDSSDSSGTGRGTAAPTGSV